MHGSLKLQSFLSEALSIISKLGLKLSALQRLRICQPTWKRWRMAGRAWRWGVIALVWFPQIFPQIFQLKKCLYSVHHSTSRFFSTKWISIAQLTTQTKIIDVWLIIRDSTIQPFNSDFSVKSCSSYNSLTVYVRHMDMYQTITQWIVDLNL